MSIETFWTVLATLITILGSTSVLKFFENRRKAKEKKDNAVADECKDRLLKLEAQKEIMNRQILQLTAEVARLTVSLEYLKRENSELSDKIPRMRTHKMIKTK